MQNILFFCKDNFFCRGEFNTDVVKKYYSETYNTYNFRIC